MAGSYYPQESIYDILKPKEECNTRPPRYVSVYNDKVKQMYAEAKDHHRHMGYAKTPLRSPQEYIHKHHRDWKPACQPCFKYPDANDRKPRPPKHDECLKLNPRVICTDHIRENVRSVLRAPLPEPNPRRVDTRNGDRQDLETAGLLPKYVYKAEYGKLPNYINGIRNVLDKSEEGNRAWQENWERRNYTTMPGEERAKILEGLEKNHAGIMQYYVTKLPLSIDTIGQKRRKLQMEYQMNLMEKDMLMLRENKNIHIQKDSPSM